MTTTKNTLDLLSSAGLSTIEARIIEYLATHQGKPASIIARELNTKRTTVYSALENLEVRRLIVRVWNKSGARFFVASAEDFSARLNERAISELIKANLAIGLLPNILPNSNTRADLDKLSGFEIRQFTTTAEYETALMGYVLKYDHLSIWDPQKAITSSHIEKRIEEYLRTSARLNLQIQDIVVSGPKTQWYKKLIKNKKHTVVELPEIDALACEVLVVNDRVVFCENSANSERAFEVNHAGFASIFKVLYQGFRPQFPECTGLFQTEKAA